MDITRRPFLGLVALAFIIGALLLFGIYEHSQKLASNAFVAARMDLLQNGFVEDRQYVKTVYANVLVDCADRAQYNSFINTDSRTMTEQELTDALALLDRCGHYSVHADALALDFFKRDVANLKALTPLFSDPSIRSRAEAVAKAWSDIYDLDKEKNDTDSRLVDIQQAYWEAELDKVRGVDTPKERETRIGALNTEARDRLAREQELYTAIQDLRQKENTLFTEAFPNAKIAQ